MEANMSTQRGFTLVELLVSVAIFTVVMVIALGSLLAISAANRKAETMKSVMNNLNFALDSMSRTIRTGFSYHCGSSGTITTPQDCSGGNTYFAFEGSTGNTSLSNDQIVYTLRNCSGQGASCPANDPDRILCGQDEGDVGCVVRSTDGGSTFAPITASEVVVSILRFYTLGAPASDFIQPKVVMTLTGYVIVAAGQTSQFQLQTSITQRIYDE
ncbi:MAG TPA: type II secretion system protein [Candidatus Paceibacterota bacterium]|nr:type II secretion system protein [Candidatus Paceibacterota bacterium]